MLCSVAFMAEIRFCYSVCHFDFLLAKSDTLVDKTSNKLRDIIRSQNIIDTDYPFHYVINFT